MALLSNTAVLLGKELRTEFRSRELLTTTVVFILTIVVLFSFTFDPSVSESRRFGPGLLWLAFLFAASLMLQPCFLREQNNDTLRELLLPLLLLPLLTPVLIASTEATAALLVPNPAMRWDWLGFLLAFDVVFLTALWLFGEYLLEE